MIITDKDVLIVHYQLSIVHFAVGDIFSF